MEKLPPEFLELCKSVTDKRPKTVIDHILKHGHITTDELKSKYGYNHPPRAARDVREKGIPLETFRVAGPDGRKIAAYRFADPSKIKFRRFDGRTGLSKEIKDKLIEKYDALKSDAQKAGMTIPDFVKEILAKTIKHADTQRASAATGHDFFCHDRVEIDDDMFVQSVRLQRQANREEKMLSLSAIVHGDFPFLPPRSVGNFPSFAGVAELADARDSKSRSFGSVGSIPSAGMTPPRADPVGAAG